MARLRMSWFTWLSRIPKETETEKVSERKSKTRNLRGILDSIMRMQYNYEEKGESCQITVSENFENKILSCQGQRKMYKFYHSKFFQMRSGKQQKTGGTEVFQAAGFGVFSCFG